MSSVNFCPLFFSLQRGSTSPYGVLIDGSIATRDPFECLYSFFLFIFFYRIIQDEDIVAGDIPPPNLRTAIQPTNHQATSSSQVMYQTRTL